MLLAVGFEVAAAVQTGADYALFATPVSIGGVALGTHHKALILVPVTLVVWLDRHLRHPPGGARAAGAVLPQGPSRRPVGTGGAAARPTWSATA